MAAEREVAAGALEGAGRLAVAEAAEAGLRGCRWLAAVGERSVWAEAAEEELPRGAPAVHEPAPAWLQLLEPRHR